MTKLVVTCEHGGNYLPNSFIKYITDLELNNTHRAFDSGAYNLYLSIAKEYGDFCKYSKMSRLLIDFNRSLNNRNVYSKYSKVIPAGEKQKLIKKYDDYRSSITEYIGNFIGRKYTIIHLSTHTFVPVLNGIERNNDIGILFDPKRIDEKLFASKWKSILKNINPIYKVRYNYPYLGNSDGFTTYLRKLFNKGYLGIELEVNQKHAKNNRINQDIKKTILESIIHLITEYKI